MEINNLTSPALADGISVIPGERIALGEETLSYLGVPDKSSQILIAERESGERICVHAADCRVPD